MAAGPGPASHAFSCESLRPLSPAILPPLTADAGEYTDNATSSIRPVGNRLSNTPVTACFLSLNPRLRFPV